MESTSDKIGFFDFFDDIFSRTKSTF
jgi:hypothetical protein